MIDLKKNFFKMIVAEIVITFGLMLTALVGAVDGGEKNPLAPLAFGFLVFVNSLIM